MPPGGAALQRFGPDWLSGLLAQRWSQPLPPLWVAWSGGIDSTALLHALVQVRAQRARAGLSPLRLRAVHVDHALQPAARAFVAHCRRVARQWQVPLRVLRVQVPHGQGESVEAAARQARRDAWAQLLQPGQWLLTAQHADDQLETFLLQALRGAGPAGLAGMAGQAPLGRGWLWRPLLPLTRQALHDYVLERQLPVIDDPSNADPRFDRNYLRQAVLGPLRARWPAAAQTVSRAARLVHEAQQPVVSQARHDAAAAADGDGLDLQVLRRWPAARQRAAVRQWLQSQALPVPDEQRLVAVCALASLRADAVPLVQWDGVQVRRHGQRLLCLPQPSPAPPVSLTLDWRWQRQRRQRLPDGSVLCLLTDPWGDVDLARVPAVLQLRFRLGGERLRTGGLHRDVKSLLRESQLPPWRRPFVPLLADAAQPATLLAVADIALDDGVRADATCRRRARFVWRQD